MARDNRKNEHVSLAEYLYDEDHDVFSDIQFIHEALPRTDLADIDLSTSFFNQTSPLPYYVNAMTGGSAWTKTVNKKIAQVAAALKIPLALGSMSAALKDPQVADSYTIAREVYPTGFIIANLGAGHSAINAQKAIQLIQASALQIHLNVAQELVMPEGDRTFKNWQENIGEIVAAVDVPVIVKEVGFGMNRQTIQMLDQLGVDAIDISGRGGTNFAAIENLRRQKQQASDLSDFETWGQTTPISLLEAQAAAPHAKIMASGGIKKPLDIIKSLALGAHATAMAGQVLHLALKDVDQAVVTFKEWNEELKKFMVLLNAKTPHELKKSPLIISGETAHWCKLRGISLQTYAQR